MFWFKEKVKENKSEMLFEMVKTLQSEIEALSGWNSQIEKRLLKIESEHKEG